MTRHRNRLGADLLGWVGRLALVMGSVVVAARLLPAAHRAASAIGTNGETGRGRRVGPPSLSARHAGHETADMNGATMARLFLLMTALVLVMVASMLGLQRLFQGVQQSDQPVFTAQQTTRISPPAPNLQADPVGDLGRLRAREEWLLNHYGWTDQTHGRARIPIARAMELMAGKPLDAPP